MDLEHGLRISLLPHMEDSIPELEPLLAPVLNLIFTVVGFLGLVDLQNERVLVS